MKPNLQLLSNPEKPTTGLIPQNHEPSQSRRYRKKNQKIKMATRSWGKGLACRMRKRKFFRTIHSDICNKEKKIEKNWMTPAVLCESEPNIRQVIKSKFCSNCDQCLKGVGGGGITEEVLRKDFLFYYFEIEKEDSNR